MTEKEEKTIIATALERGDKNIRSTFCALKQTTEGVCIMLKNGFALVLTLVLTTILLSSCAGPSLILVKGDVTDPNQIAGLTYNNSFCPPDNSGTYQVIIISVDGIPVEKADKIRLNVGRHLIRYEILDNYITSRGTRFNFSSKGVGENYLDLPGGYVYFLGNTTGAPNSIYIIYKMPLKI
ncbi:MAG TPA: hypothetical protein HPP97_06480 [Desulfuromonadales bacterium]|nr:hypothetical protein [Desulfuromonadales bacterium]